MPIFEYKCKNCQEKFEIFRSSSNTDPVICPKCDSKDTTKLFSTFASSGGDYAGISSSGSSCGPGSFT